MNLMYQEDMLYSRTKESLRKYGRTVRKSINEKVIYECAVIQYLIKQEYRTDTRNYSIEQSLYEEEKAKIIQLHNKIRKNEENYIEALQSCKDALSYIELVVRPRVNI